MRSRQKFARKIAPAGTLAVLSGRPRENRDEQALDPHAAAQTYISIASRSRIFLLGPRVEWAFTESAAA